MSAVFGIIFLLSTIGECSRRGLVHAALLEHFAGLVLQTEARRCRPLLDLRPLAELDYRPAVLERLIDWLLRSPHLQPVRRCLSFVFFGFGLAFFRSSLRGRPPSAPGVPQLVGRDPPNVSLASLVTRTVLTSEAIGGGNRGVITG